MRSSVPSTPSQPSEDEVDVIAQLAVAMQSPIDPEVLQEILMSAKRRGLDLEDLYRSVAETDRAALGDVPPYEAVAGSRTFR